MSDKPMRERHGIHDCRVVDETARVRPITIIDGKVDEVMVHLDGTIVALTANGARLLAEMLRDAAERVERGDGEVIAITGAAMVSHSP